jgi:hypothetical protein
MARDSLSSAARKGGEFRMKVSTSSATIPVTGLAKGV